MAVKIIILSTMLVCAYAIPVIYEHAPHAILKTEHHAEPHYDFSYSVHDGHTGDVKSQHESRKGDHVVGQYSLIDADGHQRTVDYTADDHNGFQAHVQRDPLKQHVKVVAPVHKIAVAPIHKIGYGPAITHEIGHGISHGISHSVAHVAHGHLY